MAFRFLRSDKNREGGAVTIAQSASLSDALDLAGFTCCGVITPSAWTAAAITFKVSMDNVTFFPLKDNTGTEVTLASANIPTDTAWAFALDVAWFAPWRYVKVQSGTNASNVNQVAARTLTLTGLEL